MEDKNTCSTRFNPIAELHSAHKDLRYPDYFPKGCPPDDATVMEVPVYRLCRNTTPRKSDFETFYEYDNARWRNVINAYGLSVSLTLENLYETLKVRPYMRKQKKAYATGIAHSHTGVIKQTGPSGHYTWWIYEGVEPHTYFEYEKL